MRAAKVAEDLESTKDLNGAIKLHTQIAELYSKAAIELKGKKSKAEKEGLDYLKTEADNDAKTLVSFTQLTQVHLRQKKFLELRLQDPESLYDVDDIRKHLAPKRNKLQMEQMQKKYGMKRTEPQKTDTNEK